MPDKSGPRRLISRRDFLRLSGGIAGLGVAYWILRPQPAFASVPPPGAVLPIAYFRAICQRCARCVAACPHRALRQDAEGLPYLDGLGGWCDLCLDCVYACPTGALRPIDPKQFKIALAVIDHGRCLGWLHGGCRLCYEKCIKLQNAIGVDNDWHPHVDAEKCNGCGACVNVCPQSDAEGRSKVYGRAVALKVEGYGPET